jgi:hypothetical protein
MAIGNGLVNDVLNTETSVRFAYAHGLVDEKAWNTLELECCQGCFGGGKRLILQRKQFLKI